MQPDSTSIARVYDELVADHYDDDAFGIISSSRALALDQLLGAVHQPRRICDFGMGTGDCLLELRREFPVAALEGVDVSARMLERARHKFPEGSVTGELTFHLGDAVRALDHVSRGSVDVAIAHFLLNYVDDRSLAAQVVGALRPGGLWSILTSTRASFPRLAGLARAFLPADCQPDLHTRVPADAEAVDTLAAEAGLEVIGRREYRHPISLASFDALVQFARHSGWFASEALVRFTDAQIEALRPALAPLFPLADEAHVVMLLCRKP